MLSTINKKVIEEKSVNMVDLIKEAKQILQKQVVVERFPAVLNTASLPASVIEFDLSKQDMDWGFVIMAIKDNHITVIYPEERVMVVGERMFLQEVKKPGTYKTLIKEWEPHNHYFHQICAKIDKTNLSTLSNIELHKIYHEFITQFRTVWALPLTATPFAYYVDKKWTPKLHQLYSKEDFAKFMILSTPTASSLVKQEEVELVKFRVEMDVRAVTTLAELKNNAPLLYLKLQQHAEKYHWLENTYREAKRLNIEHFFKKCMEIHHPQDLLLNMEQETEECIRKQKSLNKNNNFTPKERVLAKLIAEATTLQDLRKRNNLIGNYYMFGFLKELSKRNGYGFEELCHTTFRETEDLLVGQKITPEILKSRTKCMVHLMNTNEEVILNGKEAEELYDYIEKSLHPVDVNEIKGTIACPGKAKGIARVVMDVNKINTFNQGDILIASMTRPEYTPLMRKAGAIVTNEGAVTSHAAIVSRELKIPCIIGTKIATQVIKDGDLVEVDADKGIVRKIK